jgi:hypothetical protein
MCSLGLKKGEPEFIFNSIDCEIDRIEIFNRNNKKRRVLRKKKKNAKYIIIERIMTIRPLCRRTNEKNRLAIEYQ